MAWLAATGLAVFGAVDAGSANADNAPAPPDYTYSSAVTAIGAQVTLQRNPDFSSLPDPLDVEVPHSEAKLDSFGTSQADGHIVNLNGLGGIPGLVCLAAGASTCAQIPIGQITAGLIPSFPPPDPVDAHASYPAHQSASAPVLGKSPASVSVDQSGFGLAAASSHAEAHQYDASTVARAQNLDIAGVVSIGAARTTTSQTATADALTTTAVANLSNVDLGGKLLQIGHVRSSTTVESRPGKPPKDTTTTVLSDVTVAGLAATIDGSGIHLNGNGLPANVVKQVEKAVNQLLAGAGVHVALASVTRGDDDSGHSVAASGLLITFDRNVKGTNPITVALPPGVPCPIHFPVGVPDPCSGVSFSLDGAYHGQIALGQVGVVSMAQPGENFGGTAPGGVEQPPGGTVPPGGANLPQGGGSLPPGGSSQTGGTSSGGPPVVAQGQRNVADQLENVSERLEWFFPLFALGVLALIGRFRTPPRLPGPK
ncbi:hypothetical protein [Nocardioides sp.]|uniref:hypothetical protein n=1 Tax=Nocardioides sp. TaxID=35761 RepID=UPI002CF509A2|nr:hypothetical protein [Nocardioides sp.]HVX53751.1 hypothetical protein [Nocardioides sp.]